MNDSLADTVQHMTQLFLHLHDVQLKPQPCLLHTYCILFLHFIFDFYSWWYGYMKQC